MINTSIHQNSIDSFNTFDRKTRCHIVYRMYDVYGPLTDREVAERLGFKDLNSVRPRITELLKDSLLVECGNKKDALTGKTVRIVRIKLPSEETQAELFGNSILKRPNLAKYS